MRRRVGGGGGRRGGGGGRGGRRVCGTADCFDGCGLQLGRERRSERRRLTWRSFRQERAVRVTEAVRTHFAAEGDQQQLLASPEKKAA